MGIAQDLAQLVDLKSRGLLTDEDFQAAKGRVLGQSTSAIPHAVAPRPHPAPVPAAPASSGAGSVATARTALAAPASGAPSGSRQSPRHRRLASDQQQLFTAFSAHPHIRVEPLGPAPAQKYRVIYRVPGLHITPTNELITVHQHIVELNLVSGYPREKPYCTSLSPVFHPNFANHICVADYWSPSQALVDVVIQIGDMLQYKTYNTQSPLSAVAARWAAENTNRLPIGTFNLYPQEPEIHFGDSRPVAPAPEAMA